MNYTEVQIVAKNQHVYDMTCKYFLTYTDTSDTKLTMIVDINNTYLEV